MYSVYMFLVEFGSPCCDVARAPNIIAQCTPHKLNSVAATNAYNTKNSPTKHI